MLLKCILEKDRFFDWKTETQSRSETLMTLAVGPCVITNFDPFLFSPVFSFENINSLLRFNRVLINYVITENF